MSRDHAPAESSDRDGQRVLLVEDHSDIRRVLRVSLEAEGYAVVEASNGP
jgi:CheY-like chemotaxis protein